MVVVIVVVVVVVVIIVVVVDVAVVAVVAVVVVVVVVWDDVRNSSRAVTYIMVPSQPQPAFGGKLLGNRGLAIFFCSDECTVSYLILPSTQQFFTQKSSQTTALSRHSRNAVALLVDQVEKTEEMTAAAASKATDVESQARAVANGAKNTSQASQRQQQAFKKATAAVGAAMAAAEKAQASFRSGGGGGVVVVVVVEVVVAIAAASALLLC